VTHLRKKMLEELQRRNYSESTTRAYLHAVEQFAVHFGRSPDKLGPDDLRSYQAYLLVERKLAVGSVVARVAALRFFFVRILKRRDFREELPYPKSHRRLPTVLSLEEVARLIDAAGNLMQRALLMTLYGTGMRRTEVSLLKVRDIDGRRMMIRVERGKGGASRDLPLSPALLETLREYWRAGRSRGSICSPAASDDMIRIDPYPTRPFGTHVKKLPPTFGAPRTVNTRATLAPHAAHELQIAGFFPGDLGPVAICRRWLPVA
jgi:integrase